MMITETAKKYGLGVKAKELKEAFIHLNVCLYQEVVTFTVWLKRFASPSLYLFFPSPPLPLVYISTLLPRLPSASAH